MKVWFEGRELVIIISHAMMIIGPVTLSASWRERGFLLHPRKSCWL